MKILAKTFENDSVTSLLIDPDGSSFERRVPGQFASLALPEPGGWSKPHPFTISNAPHERAVRLTIKLFGEFTARVRHALEPGTEVMLKGPFGRFCAAAPERPELVLLAGGIGITPFLSLLRHLSHVRPAHQRVVLLWANNKIDDTFLRPELEEHLGSLDLRIVHVIADAQGIEAARAGSGCRWEPGLLTAETMRRHIGELTRPSVHLCGSEPMQRYVLEQLAGLGIDSQQVEKEAFKRR